jgi:hypothetical protein
MFQSDVNKIMAHFIASIALDLVETKGINSKKFGQVLVISVSFSYLLKPCVNMSAQSSNFPFGNSEVIVGYARKHMRIQIPNTFYHLHMTQKEMHIGKKLRDTV